VNRDPYTRRQMDAARSQPAPRDERDPREGPEADESREPRPIASATPSPSLADAVAGPGPDPRIGALHAEAVQAIGYAANAMRSVRERYRTAYTDELARWQQLRDDLDTVERRPPDTRPRLVPPDGDPETAADAAEVSAEDDRARALRADVVQLGDDLGSHQTDLAKLEVALRNLESLWLFLERGDASLLGSDLPTELQMRIVEAQESERSRLAQEIHDGPAQVLSNAIFQVEYIERVIDTDERLARTELRFLRELLRRELGSVRTFISQLRPAVLDELGLEGAIKDAVAGVTALSGLAIQAELEAPSARLNEAQQTVVLRIVQEALQNVRKHGGAASVIVASVIDGDDWVLTVRDDGRGFDVGAVAARGRRNFGLQFMQERAELIGARFEVQSRPNAGTVVRLAIPVGAEETA
jgi:two-component system, NarL family, sensor histidine kinase DegS